MEPFEGAPMMVVDVVVFCPDGPNVVLLTIIVELSTQPQSHSANEKKKMEEKYNFD